MREQHRRGLAHYLKTGEGPVIGKRIGIAGVRKDGSEILVELAITALKIDSAPIFTAYLRDITERTRNEEASRHLAAIVESSDDAIVSKDLNGIITSWNRGAEKLFGFSADQVINKPITVIIPPDRYHEEQQILDRIHAGERVDHFDTVRRRKDGTLVNVSITVSPIRHADGRVIGASKVARGISDAVGSARRRLAQYTVARLLAGSWNLEEASSAILQTIASIGDWVLSAVWIYDESIGRLRCEGFWHAGTPYLEKFGQFSSAIQFKMGEGLPGRVWESNEPAWIYDVVVDKNFPRALAAREARLIDDLLDLTRIARGKLQLRLQPTDAHELVQQAIEIVRADIDCGRIQLSVALEAVSHQVNVDPPRMQQVFWNILRNACKFTADTGKISVRSYNSSPNSITVEITDTGIGIKPAFLEKIFDAFEQLEMRHEGLGLGLAITKAIVETHGGSIRAQSEGSGKGATFAVTLRVVS